jgi:flagellar hook-associated protein 2
LRSVLGQVRQTLGSVSGGGDAVKSLADIGITTQKDGKLAIDDTRLTTVLSSHFDEVAALFTAHGDTSDSLLSYAGASARTAAGAHAVGVTRIATQGALAGAGALPNFGIGSAVTIDGSNDTLALRVNGIATGTITLTGGVYASGEALAAQIQARINADANLKTANLATLVEYDSAANRLVLRSDRYGVDSQIEVVQTGVTSAATLGLAAATGVPGVDVEGTLGGFAATGLGRTLTGAANTPSEGLKVDVLGGTPGARGPVTFSRGIADRLDTLVTQLLADGGALDARSDGLQSRVEDIGDQRDALDLRMTAVEARLRTQFTALDSLMAQLQKTSSFLDQQLKSLPGANTGSDN